VVIPIDTLGPGHQTDTGETRNHLRTTAPGMVLEMRGARLVGVLLQEKAIQASRPKCAGTSWMVEPAILATNADSRTQRTSCGAATTLAAQSKDSMLTWMTFTLQKGTVVGVYFQKGMNLPDRETHPRATRVRQMAGAGCLMRGNRAGGVAVLGSKQVLNPLATEANFPKVRGVARCGPGHNRALGTLKRALGSEMIPRNPQRGGGFKCPLPLPLPFRVRFWVRLYPYPYTYTRTRAFRLLGTRTHFTFTQNQKKPRSYPKSGYAGVL